jgi:hypothetical protein
MKYIFLFLIFQTSALVYSQVSFSCTYREYCDWNNYTKKFENCEGYEESSLFVMNEAETVFTHTTETIKSSYFVKSSEYDKENDVYTYNVTSDVGNDYYYIFDLKNKEVRILITKEDTIELLRFYVKTIF